MALPSGSDGRLLAPDCGLVDADMHESALVAGALHMALRQRDHDDDLLHHSDWGSQCTSRDCQTLLTQAQITSSMSGTGNCYDNAMMESFFATRAKARQAIFEFIEV